MRWTLIHGDTNMKLILLAVVALLPLSIAYGAPEDAESVKACVMCRDQMKKEIEACKSQPVGDARDLCRANAQIQAERCAKEQVGTCNLDLLMEAPSKSAPGKSSS